MTDNFRTKIPQEFDRVLVGDYIKKVYEPLLHPSFTLQIGDGWLSLTMALFEAFTETGVASYLQIQQIYDAGGTLGVKYVKKKHIPLEVKSEVQATIYRILLAGSILSRRTCCICGQQKDPIIAPTSLGFHSLCPECFAINSL